VAHRSFASPAWVASSPRCRAENGKPRTRYGRCANSAGNSPFAARTSRRPDVANASGSEGGTDALDAAARASKMREEQCPCGERCNHAKATLCDWASRGHQRCGQRRVTRPISGVPGRAASGRWSQGAFGGPARGADCCATWRGESPLSRRRAKGCACRPLGLPSHRSRSSRLRLDFEPGTTGSPIAATTSSKSSTKPAAASSAGGGEFGGP